MCLGGVEMNGLWVRLHGRSGAVGDVDVHFNEYRGRFEADDRYEVSSPSSFAPL